MGKRNERKRHSLTMITPYRRMLIHDSPGPRITHLTLQVCRTRTQLSNTTYLGTRGHSPHAAGPLRHIRFRLVGNLLPSTAGPSTWTRDKTTRPRRGLLRCRLGEARSHPSDATSDDQQQGCVYL